MAYLFYFHLFCQDRISPCSENQMQKVSLLFLQEIGYKKANGSQMMNKLMLAK